MVFANAIHGVAAARQAEIVASIDDSLQLEYVRRDVETIQSELKLDATQCAIVESLFDDYESAFCNAAERARREIVFLPSLVPSGADVQRQRESLRAQITAMLEEARQRREDCADDDLDETQWQRQFEEKTQRLREELRRLHVEPTSDDAAQRLMAQSITHLERWQAEKTRLRQQFISDVLAVLSNEQRPLWDRVERQMHREKALPRGRLSGESVDLFHIVHELRLPAESRETLVPILEQYAQRLHQALYKRDEFIEHSRIQLLRAIIDEQVEVALAVLDRQLQTRVMVRNINNESSRELAAALDQRLGEQLTRTFRARGYSRIYRTTHVQRLLSAAQERFGSDPGLLAALNNLSENYQSQIAAVNENLFRLVQLYEPDQILQATRDKFELSVQGDQQSRPHPLHAEMSRRDEIERRTLRQLESTLTPEQFENLAAGRGVRELK